MSKPKASEAMRDRCADFARRCHVDAGDFVKEEKLPDGYTRVVFERAAFFTTPFRNASIYREGSNYERPPLRERTP